MSQEERSILWEVIVSIILSKKEVYMCIVALYSLVTGRAVNYVPSTPLFTPIEFET
jgi:hypothetical protein